MVKEITPILQARMGASRLPGKMLKPICGESLLSHVVRRIRLVRGLAPMIVATSDNVADEAIEAECARLGIFCFRGSENDVLARFYEAATAYGARHIMRVCCDNPLLDSGLIAALSAFYQENSFSYVSCAQAPLGLGVEIFTYKRLADAFQNGTKPYHREHVTPYLYENNVDCGYLTAPLTPCFSRLRFTVDTPEDFAFVTAVYENLYKKNPAFGLEDVLALLRAQPELLDINSGVAQKGFKD